MITRDEWKHEAWKEAAKVRGRKRAKLYAARMDAPIYLTLFAVAGAGFGVWWLWQHVSAAVHAAGTATLPGTVAHSGIPAWLIVVAVVLLFATVALFRPGRIDRLSVLVAKWTLIPAAWLFVAGLALSSALG